MLSDYDYIVSSKSSIYNQRILRLWLFMSRPNTQISRQLNSGLTGAQTCYTPVRYLLILYR